MCDNSIIYHTQETEKCLCVRPPTPEPPVTQAPDHVSRLPEIEDDDHVSRESGDVLNIFARTSHFLKWINSEMVSVKWLPMLSRSEGTIFFQGGGGAN